LCFDHRSEKKVEILKSNLESLINNPNLIHSLAISGLNVNESHSTEKLASEFLQEFKIMSLK
jgi:hypothetical protein